MIKHNFIALEQKIGITFHDVKLLENVFIHRSYLNEHKHSQFPSNEKLEFLGDSVLSLVTSIYLYKNYPGLDEGNYTDIKAAIVRTESLAETAKKLNLGDCLLLSKGERINNGLDNKNILADTFESLVAGIFLDRGFDTAYDFIVTYLFAHRLEEIINDKLYLSPKSHLQEYAQSVHKTLPVYRTEREKGPEHNKHFTVAVYIRSKKIGVGEGASKKEAEEQAAKYALAALK